jgi:hypothetical protein
MSQQRNDPPPQRDITADREQFFSDPVGMIDSRVGDIVGRQLEKALAPILQVTQRFSVNSEYEGIKNRLKLDPRFKTALSDPEIEAAVDQVVAGANGPVTEQGVQTAILSAAGAKQLGFLGTRPNNNNNNNNVNNNQNNTPPHMRPSNAPTTEPPKKGKNRPPLDENQRTIMRINGFTTEEEYWQWMEMPANEVTVSNLGKPEK